MRALHPLPQSYSQSRRSLHRVAEELCAPARKPDNEIALRQTEGGFGTPPFEFEGEPTEVRVDGTELVVVRAGSEQRARLDSLAEAGSIVEPLLPGGVPSDASPLEIDPAAARTLAGFYALGAEALERVRTGPAAAHEPSDLNLWPEHFDLAFEAGSEAEGTRANYGASPGDDEHREPYLYVGPWSARPEGALWNAVGFPGAELGYAELLEADDQMTTAVDFFVVRLEALTDG